MIRSMPNNAAIISATRNEAGHDRRLDRDQPDALQPEGDAGTLDRLLDRLDVDLSFGVLVEHTLSSSHVGSDGEACLGQSAKLALSALNDRR